MTTPIFNCDSAGIFGFPTLMGQVESFASSSQIILFSMQLDDLKTRLSWTQDRLSLIEASFSQVIERNDLLAKKLDLVLTAQFASLANLDKQHCEINKLQLRVENQNKKISELRQQLAHQGSEKPNRIKKEVVKLIKPIQPKRPARFLKGKVLTE